jgi:hypothetical protein
MTYLNLEGRSHPANNNIRALGDNSPGRPLNRVNSGVFSLHETVSYRSLRDNCNIPRLFPLEDLLPGLLVQEIMNVDHSLDMFLGCLPTLAHQRVVELLG